MLDALDHYAAEFSKELTRKKDAAIRKAITDRLGRADWTDAEIIPRMVSVFNPDDETTTFTLDDKPLIQFWPMKMDWSQDGPKTMQNAHFSYRTFAVNNG